MTQFKYPYQIDGRGQTADANRQRHVREMIEQVLFTTPGERVNRPDFGCGLTNLLFQGNSPELATSTQYLVQGALQQWLGDVIQVEHLIVTAEDYALSVRITYSLAQSNSQVTEEFQLQA